MSLTFNGITSDSIGVIVERYPARPVPERIVEAVRVPGRNGMLTRTEGFANVRQDYEVFQNAATVGLPSVAADMAAWLLSVEGYARLEDSYNPGEFRLARFVSPDEIRNYFNRFGRCTLSFDCMPQRFLTSGEVATSYSADATITNPTSFLALPLIEVTGAGTVSFSLGGHTVEIADLSGTVTIDSEAQDAYDGATNLNSSITLADGSFPALNPGANSLTFVSGTITDITITPRWWTA